MAVANSAETMPCSGIVEAELFPCPGCRQTNSTAASKQHQKMKSLIKPCIQDLNANKPWYSLVSRVLGIVADPQFIESWLGPNRERSSREE